MAKEPGRRYQTAREIADDLRRWQRGEPIQARPVGRLERGWRWCRRKPLVAGLALAFVLVMIGGVAGISWKWAEAVQEAGGRNGNATAPCAIPPGARPWIRT